MNQPKRVRPEGMKQWQGRQWQRSEENARDLCLWVFRWGWTTRQVAGRVLDLLRPGLADEMVRRGFLEKIEAAPGWRESFVYILSPQGINLAEEEFDKFYGYLTPQPYTMHESRRIPWSIHGHHITAQHVMLDLLGARPNPLRFSTEIELRREQGDRDAVADFILHDPEEGRSMCEIELNHKEDLRMKRWLLLRMDEMRKDEKLTLHIFTPLNSVAGAFQKILCNKSIYEVRKSAASGKFVERRDMLPVDLSPFRERIKIKMLTANRQRRSGGWQYEE